MNVLFYARDAEANYGDGLLVIDTTGAARAVSLPSPQGFAGEVIAVMNVGTNAVTVTTLGTGAKINESSSFVITTQFQAARFISNGKDGSAARWYVEAEAGLAVLVDAMVYKGVIDCSGNPNYPAGNAGDTYKVSVAGKIGGASGKSVQVGDFVTCNTDGTAAGTEAQRGTAWDVIQGNIVNAAGIVNTPAGSIAATTVQAAIDELDAEKAAVAEPIAAAHIADISSAHTASAIANTPAGDIAATDVQAAIDELAAEKAALADIPTAASLISADADNALVEGTDDKLHVPEVAVPVKATGAEVTTGTDDDKFVTAKAIRDSNLGVLPKRYVALLTQSGINAPVATVLENTLGGTVVWGYISNGEYEASLSGVFSSGKTWAQISNGGLTPDVITVQASRTSNDVVKVTSADTSSAFADGLLIKASIEIRVYPA